MIEMKNLSFSFGDKVIFDDFSLKIPDKSVTAITGKSGCGKTTLINLICGLLKADKGEIVSKAEICSCFSGGQIASLVYGEGEYQHRI